MDTGVGAGPLSDETLALRRRLRLAFVTETYPPEVNGVATTAAQFVTGLHRRGHDVQLIRPRQDRTDAPDVVPRLREVLTRGLPIPQYPHLRMGVPSKRALLTLWRRERPDVVHVATEGPLGWSALRAARHLKIPVTSDFRTNFHAYSRHYGMGWLGRPILAYLRSFHNQCGCTMVPTDVLVAELQAAGFQRLRMVPRGVDISRFSPAHRSESLRAQWGAAPDDLVIGCVGRLAAEKNLAVLVAAWRALRARHPRVHLVFVGDGPLRAELGALCPEAVFAGLRRGPDLAAHYASMDLFAFPSQTETFGNVTVEALASGVPVIAFDHAAAGQLIRSGVNGMLAARDDAAGFIAAALHLAGDPALRRRIAAEGLSTVAGLGWEAVVARFEQHVAEACGALPGREGLVPHGARLGAIG